MTRSTVTACAVLTCTGLVLSLGACHATTASTAGNGQAKPATVDNSTERKDQVLANLQARYPQLVSLSPSLGEFRQIASGMDAVEMTLQTPQGPQQQTLLVLPDNSGLYMVLEGPIDVSQSAEVLAAEAARQRAAKQAALASAIEGQPVRGKADAPVTVIEFSDYECPFCKRGHETVEQLLAKYPDQVKLVFMPYPLPFHPWAMPASIAGVCAAQQDPAAHWKLYDGYFAGQAELSVETLQTTSEALLADSGIDLDAWRICLSDQSSEAHKQAAGVVEAAMAAGSEHGVDGTPAFFINGEFLGGAQPLEAFDRLVQQALSTK